MKLSLESGDAWLRGNFLLVESCKFYIPIVEYDAVNFYIPAVLNKEIHSRDI